MKNGRPGDRIAVLRGGRPCVSSVYAMRAIGATGCG